MFFLLFICIPGLSSRYWLYQDRFAGSSRVQKIMMFDNPVLTTINSIIPLAFEFRSDNNSVELNWVLELRQT